MNRLQYKSRGLFERRKQVKKPTLSNPQCRSIIKPAAILGMRLCVGVYVGHYSERVPKNCLTLRKSREKSDSTSNVFGFCREMESGETYFCFANVFALYRFAARIFLDLFGETVCSVRRRHLHKWPIRSSAIYILYFRALITPAHYLRICLLRMRKLGVFPPLSRTIVMLIPPHEVEQQGSTQPLQLQRLIRFNQTF